LERVSSCVPAESKWASLVPELQILVAAYSTVAGLSALTQTNRAFYHSWTPTLYWEALKRSPTYLLDAVDSGHLVPVQNFVEAGAVVNGEYGSQHSTLLHLAAWHGDPAVVRFLLDRGSNVRAMDSSGMTPLHRAAERGHQMMVQLLLDANAPISAVAKFAGTALHRAAECGSLPIVEELIMSGADVNAVEISGETPLHLASRVGNLTVAQRLISADAKILHNQIGQTPLHIASSQEMLDLLREVLGNDNNGAASEG